MAREESFKDWLKQRRKALDLTQAELAYKASCSIYTLQHIEAGTARPSRQLAELLAGALEIPAAERPAFVRLARSVSGQSTGQSAASTPEPANPYKGLRPFQETDALDFFGRATLTQRLCERLGEETELARFLAVVGPSGAGKSSVVRAGLLPAVRRQALPGGGPPVVVDLIPGAHPLEELESALLRVAVNPPPHLLEQLQADERGLARAAQRILPGDETRELLLVIDQFEELFTLAPDERVRADFINLLFCAVADAHSRLRVVITLRADFYDRPLGYRAASELLGQRTEVIGPLSADEMQEAITGPAQRHGLELEPGLVARIIQDVGDQPGTLPLLQYTLTELYERREDRRLTRAAYEASGGVFGSLARRAESLYSGLSGAEQSEARQFFLRLVTPGDSAEDTRRRVLLAELRSAVGADSDGRAVALERVLDLYGRYRMLAFDRDPQTGAPTVEVAHEALLSSWPRLRGWLDASHEQLLVQRRLLSSAAEWQAAGQDRSFLARGARLAQFTGLRAEGAGSPALALTVEEQAYLTGSLREQEQQEVAQQERQAHELMLQKRAANRLRVLLAGAAVFLVVAIGLALFALDQSGKAQASAIEANHQRATAVANGAEAGVQRQAAQASAATAVADFQHAEAQRLAAEANTLLQARGNTDVLVALLAIRSLRTQYTPEGDAMLGLASTLAYPQQQFSGHTGGVHALAFSPDGKWVLTSSDDGTPRLWDAATGQTVQKFSGHTAGVRGVAFSPDGQTVLTGSADTTARLWNAATGQELQQFRGHTKAIWGVAFSPDGKQVLTGSLDQTARLWDAATGHEVRQFVGHTAGVNYVAFSPDGKQALTGSDDNTARLWDAATGQPLRTLSGHTGRLRGATFAPDGKTVLTGGIDDGAARLWDAQTGKELRQFRGHPLGVRSVAFAPDGTTILTGGLDHLVKWWDVATGAELRTFAGHTDQVNGVAFSPDGQLFVTGGQEGIALLWRLTLPPAVAPFSSHTGAVGTLAFSPDGKYLLTGSGDTTARLWDVQTRAEVRQFAEQNRPPNIAFSPDGKSILTNVPGNTTARLWDTQTGAPVITFTVEISGLSRADFTPDGKGVLTTDLDGAYFRLWDAQTGRELRRWSGPGGSPLLVYGFSPDGKWVLTMRSRLDTVLRIWDIAAGREVRQFVGLNNVLESAAFSPDGKYVLTASRDVLARLWDAQTAQEIRRFVGHTQAVRSAVFSPDGKYVLTGSEDKTARLWDAQTGQELRRFAGHTDSIFVVAFAPNGRQIATASADGTARLWDLDYQDTLRTLCGRLLRDLTPDERTQYGITGPGSTCPAH
jgi:WD40 repeat protein/transcriptional regulator with XRE-family HTH domain